MSIYWWLISVSTWVFIVDLFLCAYEFLLLTYFCVNMSVFVDLFLCPHECFCWLISVHTWVLIVDLFLCAHEFLLLTYFCVHMSVFVDLFLCTHEYLLLTYFYVHMSTWLFIVDLFLYPNGCLLLTYFCFQFAVPVVWLTLFDVVLLILLIPATNKFIYPFIRRQGWRFTCITRIQVGLYYAFAAIICAGVVEHFRLQRFWSYVPPKEMNITNTHCCYEMVPQKLGKLYCG